MFRKDIPELKSNRKWASSHTLDVGILIETKKAFASTISYPKLKKLPPLTTKSSLDLSQNPFSRNDYRSVSRIMPPQPLKEVPKYHRKEALDLKLKSFNDLYNQSTEYITISNSTDSYSVPSDVLFRSLTIQHIYEATKSRIIFKESDGNINFPVSDLIMKEVLCYLYAEWTKENLGLSHGYVPGKENVMQILEFGLYLGLQGLVEMCCDHICLYIKDIESLDGLPDPVATKIFSQMESDQLIEWEFKNSRHNNLDLIRASYVYHFNQGISKFLGYVDKVKFDSTAQYQSFCRKTCIQSFFDTNVLKPGIDACSFRNLLAMYGPLLTNLNITVEHGISTSQAQNLSASLKNLKSLSILFVDYQMLNLCELLLGPSVEKLSLSFGGGTESRTVPAKTLSKLLKILSMKRKTTKFKRNHYLFKDDSKMDVSGINHFTSDESTVSELMNDYFVEGDLQVILNFHFVNDDIVYYFENCSQNFTSANISCLCLEKLKIGFEGAVILAQELLHFRNLQTLNISGAIESEQGICYLMKHLPPLKKLDLSQNISKSGSLESLEAAKLIAKYIMRSDSCLEYLNLSQNRFSFIGIRNILEALDKGTTRLSIDLSNMEIKSCLAYISKAANFKFSSINLNNNSIVPRSLNDFLLIPALIGIEHLDFCGNFLDQSVLDCLADQISHLKLPILTTLKLAGCVDSNNLDDAAFKNLLLAFVNNSCKNIKELDLSCHHIGDQSCMLLAQICIENKKFEILNLEKNRITFDGLTCFTTLGNKKSRILRINFSKNYIHGSVDAYRSSKKWRHFFRFDDQFKE